MRIIHKHLLLCVLIILFRENAAEKFSLSKDVLPQDTNFSQDDDDLIDYRLPKSVKPISYNIGLKLDSQTDDGFLFDGVVNIQAKVIDATNNITLHVGNLKIIKNEVNEKEKEKNIIDVKYDNITEKYTLFLSETLEKDTNVNITFQYKGLLTDNMIGFYRSLYIENGDIKWLAATQFQTTHARHAFPCFDEPNLKATFTISISRNKTYMSLSNMPRNITASTDSLDVYEKSVPMSTYLVAFILSDFHSLGENEVKVWARPSAINQTSYALKIGTAALKLLEDLFQQEYILPKMDMVAVPDFAAGAMENWGLVTYRETRMLYDEKESSAPAQQSVASVIVHEITHMWFGNLVTPEWWSYLWLSEAFARFFQYFGTALIEKDWNMREQFVVEQHQVALITDSFQSSRPMTREVSSQSQIGTMGDTITYAKGASIVRMMGFTFGIPLFKLALQDYLQNNKETGLSNPDALWEAIQNRIDKNSLKTSVKSIMDTWTTQAGYPVISVTIDKDVIRVTQERFLLRNNFLDETPTNVTWWVPLSWTTQSDPNFDNTTVKHWLSNKTDIINLTVAPKDWMIFNIQSSGFYRVKYNSNGWQRIFGILNSDRFDEIHVLNRANILDDLLNLCRAGYENYKTVLVGLTYLKRETNYLPFKAALNNLDYINRRFTGREEHFLLKKYILSLIDDRRKELGYEDRDGDDRLTVLLRRELNNWACNLGDQNCITTYVKKFKTWKEKNIPIHPNERSTAYCVAMRTGTSEDWEFLWENYFNSNHAADQVVILGALGCSLNTTILEEYLLKAINSFETTRIRRQDSTSVFAAVYNSGPIGAEYIFDFVEKYYKKMEEYYKGQNTIATIINGASQRFSTPELVYKFDSFLDKHATKLAPIRKSLESSLKSAKNELKWYQSVSRSIILWLQENSYRLPGDIIPQKYFISIKPNFEINNFYFDGNVTIEANVVRETQQIILHSAEINFGGNHATMKVMANETEVEIVNKAIVEEYDFLIIDVSKNLSVGTNLIIEISYSGHLNPSELRGFYKSSYLDENGKLRWLVATHLEPVGARKMFPCFDEPAFKAIFTIQVIVPPDYHAISNTNWRSLEKLNADVTRYTFSETAKMSTYLVALVVSDFKFKSAGQIPRARKVNLGVYARPNAINQTEYAASVMLPLVNFFENALKHEIYQMPKLDMIALPDFPSGAGENWGLITYRETNLLYDEDHSPFTSKQTIRNVIAHEISHQWFGNLVTLSWWKYLWLNEGFARYFEYHAPAIVFNDTTLETQFVVNEVHSALSADASSSTHAMSHDVYNPREIRGIFSTITYAKGASILRMIEKSYGSTVFYKALIKYLQDRQYDVATPEDLYKALQAQVTEAKLNGNVKAILDSWTTQPGYPIVHVSFKKDSVTLKQERFFLKKREEDPVDTMWHIPITWASIDNYSEYLNTTPRFWMANKEETFQTSSLFTLNVQQSGFYRVNYDEQHWLKLIDYLTNGNFSNIHEINRAAIIDDLMNFARTDYVSYETAILATMYLKEENDYLPWRAFYNNLPYLNNRFRGYGIEDLYNTYLTSIIKPLYERLDFVDRENDDDLTKMLRMHTRKWACKLDIGNCRSLATAYFLNKHNYNETIPPHYRSVVYCTAMSKDMTEKTYYILWKEYLNSNVAADKLVILSSLACSPNPEILEILLKETIITNDTFPSIRFQDSTRIFSNVYDASLAGVEAVMNVISNYYDDMHQYFGGYEKIKSIVSALASRLSTYELYEQYQVLLDQLVQKEPAFKQFVRSFMAEAEYEFDWYNRKVPLLAEKLDKILLKNKYRLPNTLYPEYYNVHLTPHMEKGIFDGEVQIYMRVVKNTTIIILNADNIKQYDNIKVSKNYKIGNNNPDAMEIPVLNYTKYDSLQQLRIYLNKSVNTKQLMVEIKFIGILSDDMKGFYRSSYEDSSGKRHWLATTQFEPTYARRAFPCFDEPAFKSKFIINIKRQNHYNTRSNMPLIHSMTKDDYTVDRFETNKIDMSPYLVAFVVSEFEPVNKSEQFLNVWGRPEIANYGQFAQDTGKSLIKALNNITDIDYQLPKLDLVGVPDFDMGAMENWGLAIFREYGLFYNKTEMTTSQEKYIITVIAHELAHMWFGNLVTCEWWDYIWLNEGFAQYFEWFASDMILPSYKFMDQFVVYELHPALLKDASASVHPMTNAVETPEQINSVFDYVAYGKSASVLRMLFNAFEPKIHMLAIRSYLKEQSKRGTARPEDLWRSFNTHISIEIDYRNMSFVELMASWTNQSGYPVVKAVLRNFRLTLSQERFLMNEWIVPPEKRERHNEFYWIPIDIITSLEPFRINLQHKMWLGSKSLDVHINSINDWFIVNRQQTGFYRVNYDNVSWRKLIEILNSKQFGSIPVVNRAQIIDDLFNLARATYVDYRLLMNATEYLTRETDHLPWKAFFNGLSYIYERFEQQNVQTDLTKYVLHLMSTMYDKTGFDDRKDDTHLDKLNREMILQWACKLHKKECTKKSKELFAAWRKNPSKRIPPNARAAVYCTAIREGTADDWEFLWQQYLKTNFTAERKIIINALGCSMNKTALHNYLRTAVEEYNTINATFRKQDVSAVFSSVYSASQLGVNVALDYLVDNAKEIRDHFGNWDKIVSFFHNIASHISNVDQYEKLKKFIEFYMGINFPDVQLKLDPAITTAKINLMWYTRNKGVIHEWMLIQIEKIENLKPITENNGSTIIKPLNACLMAIVIVTSYLLSYH